MIQSFIPFSGLNVSFNTSTNCLLKCKYCYEFNKSDSIEEDKSFWEDTKYSSEVRTYSKVTNECSKNSILSFETAKKFIDKLLSFDTNILKTKNKLESFYDNIVLDFIGGDSLQYYELVDSILTYWCNKVSQINHKWYLSWKASISSNGLPFLKEKVKDFYEKWKDSLQITISIDGCKELHDLNRVCYANNSDGSEKGSFKYIEEIWPWYSKISGESGKHTKWTIAPNSYKYLFKSVKYLYEEMGIKYISFNRVMEQSVQDSPEELVVLIEQFLKIVDYTIEHHNEIYLLPLDYDKMAANQQSKKELMQNDEHFSRCGFGKMPALAIDGSIYSCFRMLPGHTNLDTHQWRQGHVDTDIVDNPEMVRFMQEGSEHCSLDLEPMCEECPVYSSCQHCAAGCFLEQNGKSFKRTTSICNYHKIEVAMAQLYWEQIKKLHPLMYQDKPITWDPNLKFKLLQEVEDWIKNKS